MNHLSIRETFEKLRAEGRAALMPYLTIGYPTPVLSVDLAQAAVEAGADMLELGIPFSDPLADGATIQHTTQVALDQGTTVGTCLDAVAELRRRGVGVPLLLMGYYNPIFQWGTETFCAACRKVGADGLIVPDLPPEEADELHTACREYGLDLIMFLAPTSTDERVREVVRRASGFLYLVSLTGVTGARDRLPADLESFVARVRRATDLPLAVGFGVGNPQQAARVARIADGVIVGSALLRAIGESDDPIRMTKQFVRELRQGMEGTAFDEARGMSDTEKAVRLARTR
jgi:tryptophan synthase alpha chain